MRIYRIFKSYKYFAFVMAVCFLFSFSLVPAQAVGVPAVSGEDNPGVAVIKKVNPTTAKPGDQVEYTIVVANPGKEDIEDIHIYDSMLWETPQILDSLAAGATHVYKESYTIPAEQPAGELANTVGVCLSFQNICLSDVASAVLTVTGTEEADPGISISKEVNPAEAEAGEQVEYTITVTNTGDVDLADIEVSDSMLWESPRALASLAAGAEHVYKENYTIPAEQSKGELSNTAAVSVSYEDKSLSDEAAAVLTVIRKQEVNVNPGISISKEVSPAEAEAGEQVEYTITVRNTGDADLADIEVSDSMLWETPRALASLAAGAEHVYKENYTIPAEQPAGELANTAAVSVSYEDKSLSDEAAAVLTVIRKQEVNVNPGISIAKEVSPAEAEAGEQVEYTITVRNTGDADLADIEVSDSMLWETPRVLKSLSAGAEHVYKESYTIPAEQPAGELLNTAGVSVFYDGQELADRDAAAVVITSAPGQGGGEDLSGGIEITKTVAPAAVKPGNEVTYTIIIENTGELNLSGVKAVDPMLWEGERNIGDLAAGESVTIVSSYKVAPETISGTTIINTAVVTGYHGDQVFTDEDSADLLVKRTNSGGSSGSGGSNSGDTSTGSGGESTVDPVNQEEPQVETEEPQVEPEEEPQVETEDPVGDETQELVVEPEAPGTASDELDTSDSSIPELPKTGTGNLVLSSMGVLIAAGGLLLTRYARKRDK